MEDLDESSCCTSLEDEAENSGEEEEEERSHSSDDACVTDDCASSSEAADSDGNAVADDPASHGGADAAYSRDTGGTGSDDEDHLSDSARVESVTTSAAGDETRPSRKTAKQATDPGIIYLSRIPQYMGVKKVRHVFSQYGDVGRIFLQPDTRQSKKKKSRLFTEGWVEFLDKRIAKRVALSLNNSMVGGKRRSIWYDELWNLKYLKGFKWGHLNERLAYEKAVHQQRMRTEIAQAKKEATFYAEGVQKLQVIKKVEKRKRDTAAAASSLVPKQEWSFKQRKTDEMRQKKPAQKTLDRVKSDKAYLRNIFS